MPRAGNLLTVPGLANTGITGAVSASRWVGATAAAAPTTGTFLLGDYVVTLTGKMFVCTTAGSPGTWTEVGSGAAPGNMVTTDTTQTLTAGKVWTADNGVYDPIELRPTTAATAGVQNQDSPYLRLTSNRWAGAVSATDPITLSATRVSAAAGDQYLAVFGSHNGLRANSFKPNGLTGATTASRWVGATASVAPTTGTFLTGDWVVTLTGRKFICTAGGSPGTWAEMAPGNMVTTDTGQTLTALKTMSLAPAATALSLSPDVAADAGNITRDTPRIQLIGRWWNGSSSLGRNAYLSVGARASDGAREFRITGDVGYAVTEAWKATGMTGAATATRWVGGTASVAPTTGTFEVGDFVVTLTGRMFVCAAGGSPGTWVEVGVASNMMTTDTNQTVTGIKTWSIVSDNSAILLNTSDAATAGATTKHSPIIEFQTRYWNGSASVTETPTLQARRTGATAGAYYLNAGAPLRADTFQPGGLTGATAASRYVGAVSGTEAPTSGTFQAGDWCITQLGSISVCTVGGTPGTWVTMYSDGNPPQSLLKTEGSTPGTPASGLLVEWVSSTDSRPYWKNDGGEVGAMWNVEPYTFSVTGTLADATGKSRIYLEGNYVLETVRAAVNTAPTGGNEIIDVNKNGTTIYGTQANRPTIASGGNSALGGTASVTTFAAGDYITVDIDPDGTATGRAADLTVTIRLRKVA